MVRASSTRVISSRKRCRTIARSVRDYVASQRPAPPPECRGGKAVGYLRVSTKGQVDHGTSLEYQEQVIRRLSERSGYRLDRIFHDDGISGRNLERKGLNDMLEYVESNPDYGFIISYDPSRLTRNAWLGEFLIRFCLETGVKLRFIDTDFDLDSAEGRRSFRNACTAAMFIAERAAEDSRDRGFQSRARGIPTSAPPVGYLKGRNSQRRYTFTVDPELAPLVRKAFELAAGGGMTNLEIIEYLDAEGFRSKTGGRLSAQGLSSMLRNRHYTGMVEAGRDWIKANFDPIVSTDLFERVQRCLAGGSTLRPLNAVDRPLMRFARCRTCNRALTAYRVAAKPKHMYYRCNSTPKHLHLSVDKLESAAAKKMSEFHLRPEIIPALITLKDDLLDNRANLLQSRIRNSRARMDIEPDKARVFDDYATGKLTADEYRTANARLEARAEKCAIDLCRAQGELQSHYEFSAGVICSDTDLGVLWQTSSVPSQREMQELFFPEGLVVDPSGSISVHVPAASWMIEHRGDDETSPAQLTE